MYSPAIGRVSKRARMWRRILGQLVGVVGADVEDRGLLLGLEGVEADGEDRELAGAARRLAQPPRVGVEPGGRRGVDVADVGDVFAVGGPAFGGLWGGQLAALDAGEDLLGVVAERQAEVVDEGDRAVRADLGVEAHLGIGRPTVDQRAARVVADAAEHRGTDAGGADHRMRLAAERTQRLLQRVEGGAGQADDLAAAVDQVDAREAAQADEDDLAVVVVAPGGRAAGEAGVGGLEDDDAPGGDRGVQYAPLLDEAAGADHRRDRAVAVAEAAGVAAGVAFGGQDVAGANDAAELGDQLLTRGHGVSPWVSGPGVVPRTRWAVSWRPGPSQRRRAPSR